MTFVDLEKAFDRVPRKVLCWALHVAGVPEWLVKVGLAVYVRLGAPGISIKSCALYHSPGSTLTQILCRVSMGNALCR